MKSFWQGFFLWTLIFGMVILGDVCLHVQSKYKGLPVWQEILLVLGSQLVLIPAIRSWERFFKELFDLNKNSNDPKES